MKRSTNLYESRFRALLKKEYEEDENTVGGGALGAEAGIGHSGMVATDWYATGDTRLPVYLGMTTRSGKVNGKRRRKKKNRKQKKKK